MVEENKSKRKRTKLFLIFYCFQIVQEMLSAPLPTTQYISEQTSTAAIGAHLVADRHNKVNSDLKYCSRSLKEEATQCV